MKEMFEDCMREYEREERLKMGKIQTKFIKPIKKEIIRHEILLWNQENNMFEKIGEGRNTTLALELALSYAKRHNKITAFRGTYYPTKENRKAILVGQILPFDIRTKNPLLYRKLKAKLNPTCPICEEDCKEKINLEITTESVFEIEYFPKPNIETLYYCPNCKTEFADWMLGD